MHRLLLFLLFFVSLAGSIEAKHIVGGEMTYECLGNNNYRFTLRVYRDCNCTGCATLDNPAHIAIYEGQNQFMSFDVNLTSTTPVPIPDEPCMQVPDVCVQVGLYVFERNLPPSNQSYTAVYQRCCRNITISNIIDPDNSGATYSVEILPIAQQECNNSPTYTNFPPTVICANFPLIFDHSAIDIDGDQLVYSFCNPLLGGGVDGGPDNPGGDPESCTGVSPNPPCGPPFDPVSYVIPTYTFATPLAGNPIVSINANTGLITGTPTTIGQYVVGVCVQEYRNGVLMSTVQRDFQFNVTDCQPVVGPNMVADSLGTGNTFYYRLCGDLTLDIINQSYQIQNIDTFAWVFDIGGNDVVFSGGTPSSTSNWDPSLSLPDYGTYVGILYLNPGLVCNDTGYVVISAYPGNEASFTYSYDTCIAGPVTFVNTSQPLGNDPILLNIWDFDDGSTEIDFELDHLFAYPGLRYVSLTTLDSRGCRDTTLSPILWQPAPPEIIIAPNDFEGCVPQSVYFDNLSFPIDSTYDIDWTFGDGGTSDYIDPSHVYEEPGLYDVYVSITSPIGCFIDTTFENLILMQPSPTALFTFEPNPVTSFNPLVQFTDLSLGASAWFWRFDSTFNVSYKQNPSFEYQDTGQHIVMLIVTHQSGCKDTLYRLLDVIPDITYFIPNAFSPNEDGGNEFFAGVGFFEGMRDFNMQIYNRWGEQVFEAEDPTIGWNGTVMNEGDRCESGVYVYKISLTKPRGQLIKLEGFVTLVR
jgi:gliding motility-associated-like protein